MNHLKTIVEIALFKGKPNDIDYNIIYLLLPYCIVLVIGTTIAGAEKINNPGFYAFIHSSALGLLFYLVLLLNNKATRFIQGASALYGVIALSQIIAYSFIFILTAKGIAAFISLWSAAVQIYIIRETLECKLIKAVALYACIQFVIFTLLLTLFPDLNEILQNTMNQKKSSQ